MNDDERIDAGDMGLQAAPSEGMNLEFPSTIVTLNYNPAPLSLATGVTCSTGIYVPISHLLTLSKLRQY